jgi:hypothetical protein
MGSEDHLMNDDVRAEYQKNSTHRLSRLVKTGEQ